MMYNNKFIACLKVDGKILREVNDTVYVPFGSTYQIFLKNLNSSRALVNIQIDGTEVCPNGLVVGANHEIDLERFIKDGNLTSGNSFKFIERTAGIEQHRGIKAEDGIIRISFKFEKPRLVFTNSPLSQWPDKYQPGYYPPCVRGDRWYTKGGVSGSAGDFFDTSLIGSVQCSSKPTKGLTRGVATSDSATLSNASFGSTPVSTASYSAPVNDVGITVPGAISTQKFSTTTMGELEDEEHVIVLRILGETAQGTVVVEPLTVKSKPTCATCGRVNKVTSKFCTNCGTSLTII